MPIVRSEGNNSPWSISSSSKRYKRNGKTMTLKLLDILLTETFGFLRQNSSKSIKSIRRNFSHMIPNNLSSSLSKSQFMRIKMVY